MTEPAKIREHADFIKGLLGTLWFTENIYIFSMKQLTFGAKYDTMDYI